MTPGEALTADAVVAFAAFSRHLNFTRAAEELHVAQPSLHAKVAKLSRSLDVTLYEKVGRELILTPAGKALAAFAADQERSVDDFLAGLGAPTRPLRLAAGRAAIQWVLDRPLRAVVRRGPDLHVTPADRSTALRLVETGEVDVAAIAYDPPPRHLRSVQLAKVPQVLVAHRSHPVVSDGHVRLRDLDGLAIVVPPEGRPHRQSLERALDAAGVGWKVASEADGWDLILHLVKLGVGAAVVNGCIPVPRPLKAVEIEDLPHVGYWLAWREQRQEVVDRLLKEVGWHG
jgi:DNA-binding transcriptional LysR family regulator